MVRFWRRKRPTGSTHGATSIPGRDKILQQLLDRVSFRTIVDVGCGVGDFFLYLQQRGVSFEGVGIDMVDEKDLVFRGFEYVRGHLFDVDLPRKFDLVFTSHTIEHVPDTATFLRKFFSLAHRDSHFCIIWPPPKKQIVGGHVHVFNPGLLLYNLVRCGVDCRDSRLFRSGYNLAVIGPYRLFQLPPLTYNRYELETLKRYFPFPVKQGFDGDVEEFVEVL